MERLQLEVQAGVDEEDEALLEAEAQLPGGDEIHWSELETNSSEDEDYFPPAPPQSPLSTCVGFTTVRL